MMMENYDHEKFCEMLTGFIQYILIFLLCISQPRIFA